MFKKDFIWGAGAAAFQVEGAIKERGRTVWDMFCGREGMVRFGDTTDVTCDHYHLYKEDVALMKELGLMSYRMSICWSRILPAGTGAISREGVAFYNALFDELLANGIKPLANLFTWDLPYELHKKGGWLNPDSPKWFAEYTKACMDAFSDRVDFWETHNETQSFVESGYWFGEHAPGMKYSEEDFLQICHNVHLGHGYSLRAIRENAKLKPTAGQTIVSNIFIPEDRNNPEHIAAAYSKMFDYTDQYLQTNALWIDPLFFGCYHDQLMDKFKKYDIPVSKEDMELISQPLDFLGANIYRGEVVNETGVKPLNYTGGDLGYAKTAFGWSVAPEVIYWTPKWFHERYKVPIYITENGMSGLDWVALDGKVHDPQRIDFTQRFLRELGRAIDDGADVRGYYSWCLMDNFECAAGNSERFGLIYVDFDSQKRIIKDSGHWYRTVIESNGANL